MDGSARSPFIGVVPDAPQPASSTEDHPLVVVTWHDAWFDLELDDLAGAPEHYAVRTVGYLVRTGAVVSLAQEILPDGDGYRAVTHIPRAMVRTVERLDRPVVAPPSADAG